MNNNIDNNMNDEKIVKVAFSGKVLPSTSEDFEKLFEGVTNNEGKKLQFEDKLKMVIQLAKEKMLENELNLEKDSREDFDLDIKSERTRIGLGIEMISRALESIETNVKAQITNFKAELASDVLFNAKAMNNNTVKLLEDFQEDYANLSQQNQETVQEKENISAELEEAKSQIKALESKLEACEMKLEKAENAFAKATKTIEEKDIAIAKIQDKYNAQLEKNDELRDAKDTLETELNTIHKKHSEEVSLLESKIEELQNNVSQLDLEKSKLNTELDAKVEKINNANSYIKRIKEELENCKNEVSEYKISVNVKDKEVQMLNENIADLKEIITELKNEKTEIEKENKELSIKSNEIDMQNKNLIEDTRQASTKIEELEEVIITLKQENEKLKAQK